MSDNPLYRNGLNAIQTGVDDFNEGSPERLASAVRNLTAGILLLCKEKLRRLSPYDEILIWKNLKPCLEDGELVFEKVGNTTVDVWDIEERFKSCGVECDVTLLKRIAKVRNAVEHHYVEDSRLIQSAFVDGLRFLTSFMPDHLGADPRDALGAEAWESLIEQKEVEDALRAECRASYQHIDWPPVLQEAIEKVGCPECGSHLVKQNDAKNTVAFDATWSCAACGHSEGNQEWAGKILSEYFAAESYMAAKDGGLDPVDSCPECGEEAFVHEAEMCLACGVEPGDLGECMVCSEPLGLDDYGESLCSYHRYVAEKERDS
ncbi:hypothetical protein [Luteibacter sp.]|jgi:DNA-directed RNA polymerase subunit M/transcription elongation factor TFIIS|uniref:hypothetical protein n=1 Tax=Luteibacter sp. TaxID=1886636 RepID=UPI002F422193